LARSAVAIALPRAEFAAVRDQLAEAGYEAVAVHSADELDRLLDTRGDLNVAVLDAESDFDGTLEMYAVLHEGGRGIPALMLMPPRSLGRMGIGGSGDTQDEYFTRPYSAESLRWRIEAMLIRVENETVEKPAEDGLVGSVGGGDDVEPSIPAPARPAEGQGPSPAGHKHGRIVIVFNPKGGVGKTTISINVGAALRLRRDQRVLLVDCDTITGHLASSLGLERPRTLASAWRDDARTGAEESMAQIATVHSSGMGVLVLAESPLHTEILDPRRVAEAILAARESYDWVILDMHPDYGPLNQALFEQADKIIVPVTPDIPCIRAAVQFRDVADELGIRERLSIVINRANSGIGGSDVERVVVLPSLGRVRSAGMLFVRAADEGKSAVERFPTAKVIGDIDGLADRLLQELEPGGGAGLGFLARRFRGFFERRSSQVS
jgi:MinD-like ATPase involved in chromosome partitioning or flagellar assembly